MYEYELPLSVVVLIIGLFICIVNANYARINSKNPSTWKKKSVFTTYKAWLIYAFCITVMIIVLMIFSFSNIIIGISNFGNEQNSVSQIQQQLTSSDSSS
jgi:uncharacterized membrane protein